MMYVLVQPSYSDKIYDLTFLKKANSINSGSGLTLTTALSTTVPHRWTMDSFKFQHQDDSLSLPATFIIFFFRRGVALFGSINGCFFRNSQRKLLSHRRQSLANPISKTQELKSYQKFCSPSRILYKTTIHLLKVNPN